jgi:AraC family transcriptional regulator, exoenzyme S synthesis regulatory protein ExsA
MINLYQTVKQHPGYFKQLQCKEMLFTQYDCPQAERKETFFIECSYIAYVISGRRIFHKLGKTWDLSEGVSVFVKKGIHIAEKLGGDGWCVLVFFIPDNYLVQFFQQNKNSFAFNSAVTDATDHVLPLEINEVSKSFFYSMIPYFSQTPPPHEDLLELKFKELLFSILFNNQNLSLLSHLNTLASENYYRLQTIMEANFTSNLSLEQYALLACKSLPTFKRHFQATYHDTPASWIKKRRVQFASDLLHSSGSSIKDIAYECGFENHTHFNRVFKELKGVTPLAFRKNTN